MKFIHEVYDRKLILKKCDFLEDHLSNSIIESPRMIAFFDSLVRRDVDSSSSSDDDNEATR